MYSQNAMKTNTRKMDTAMEQLSTGTRVNSAKDDAAGLAIGQNMTSQIRGLNMAVRNLNDGINMMQTAEGGMIEQSNMLQRMRELAVQANNGTYSNTQRSYLSLEYEALGSQIAKIATETKWNDQSLLTGSTFTYQSGQASGQTIAVTITAMTLAGMGLTNIGGISTAASAAGSIALIGSALETVNLTRAAIGAGINQMEYAADNVTNIASNTTQSRSTIMDTDYALATTQLAKTQIIQQAATAMLAQANQQPQSVMALLKG
jgi:flagellin